VATPTRERNKRGEGERLREALLDATSELLAESPDVEQLSVRAVTARAGVTPTALYLHFADKDDLARAVKKRCFAELAEALRAAADPHDGDPLEQLRAMGHAYLRYASEHPGHYAMMFHTTKRTKRSRTQSAAVRAIGMETFTLLVEATERCLGGRGDAFETASMLWLSLHGRAAIQQAMPWFPLPDEERFIALLFADRIQQRTG
jgi:AcrR family transcriptional regulator